VRSAGKACYTQARACRRSGTVRSDIVHSGTVHLGIVHLGTAHRDTVHSGNVHLDTAAGIHSTAAVRSSYRDTCGSSAGCDGTVAVAAAGTGEQREGAASGEMLLNRRYGRRCELLQLLPVYSAQPADGGYSSCRLGG
jgi:hypothetical protein